jgi:hypothetical protein
VKDHIIVLKAEKSRPNIRVPCAMFGRYNRPCMSRVIAAECAHWVRKSQANRSTELKLYLQFGWERIANSCAASGIGSGGHFYSRSLWPAVGNMAQRS